MTYMIHTYMTCGTAQSCVYGTEQVATWYPGSTGTRTSVNTVVTGTVV